MKKITLLLLSLLCAGSMSMFVACEDPHEHAFGTQLQHNDTHHYYTCECGEKKDEVAHTYDKQVADETYFKEETSANVTFFKSCTCGAKGTETFVVAKQVGELTSFSITDKSYDGLPITAPAYQTNSTGAVTVEYKVKSADDTTYTTTAPTDVGEYTVRVSVAGNRVYSPVSETKDFAISKCEISGLSQSFTYNGSTKHTVELPTSVVPESGISLEITFDSANADAHPVGVKVLKEGIETNNYEVKNCTATIEKKEIHIPSLLTKEYDGNEWGTFEYTFTTADGLLAGDTATISFDAGAQDEVVNVGVYNDCYFSNEILTGMENYELVENTCNVEITPKILRFEDVYVKDYDGTNIIRFDFNDISKDGIAATEGVYVKIEALEYDTPESNPLKNVGYYAQADFGPAQFYTSDNSLTENYSFDDNYFQGGWSGFELWILDANPLIIEVVDRFNIGTDYILSVKIKQGAVRVGDSIILPGSPDKVYEVLKIEKYQKEQGQANVGEEVGIYIDGMADLSEVVRGDFLYTQGEIPELATTFFASIYAKTQEEGGRTTPFNNGYAPNIIGLGDTQVATINIVDVYGKDDIWVAPGDSALVKITLTTALPASLLENFEFTLFEGGRVTATGVGVDYVESSNYGNSMVATDNFDAVAGMPTVIRLTNTRNEALNTLQFYVSNGAGTGNYLTDFTIKLYDSSFNLIDGTHNNSTGAFTKTADSSTWSLGAEETCYIVITLTNATEDVFAWLS